MADLNELQQDAVAELLNMSMGAAAASLSEMIDEEVGLSIPFVEIMTREEAAHHFSDSRISGVKESFSGAFWGEALLLFPELNSLELVRAILKDSAPLEELTDLEEEVLVEVGNVLLNSCLSTLADVLQQEIRTDIPSYVGGGASSLFDQGDPDEAPDESVMLVRIEFTVEDNDIRGHVVLILESDALTVMLRQIEQHMLGM